MLIFLGNYLRSLKYLKDPKTDMNLDFESVEFKSNEEPHLNLRGWYIPANNVCNTQQNVLFINN